jgi:hypothetical protein
MQDITLTYLVNGTTYLVNGTWPHDRGFEKSFTLLNGGANHFKGFPEAPIEHVAFAENGKMVTRPGNNSLYSNGMYTDILLIWLSKLHTLHFNHLRLH